MFEAYGFSIEHIVEGRTSIADLFTPKHRCGLYILHFRNGQYYAGQAQDVVRRFAQHRLQHNDIIRLSFKVVSKHKLNESERALIWELERQQVPLRNIMFTSLPSHNSDFDLVMPVSVQEHWMLEGDWTVDVGERIVNPTLRMKYTNRYHRLMRKSGITQVILFLKRYVEIGIPYARQSEVSFWGVSCLPTPFVYSRININWQEVLTVYVRSDEQLWCSFHMARSPFDTLSDAAIEQFIANYPTSECTNHYYEPGGHDQLHFDVPLVDSLRFIDEPIVQACIRTFNLRLMKKGACVYGRYHCLDLADHLLT